MEHLQNAFEPYRHLDPLGWVGVFRLIPVYGGLIAIALGVLMMLIGGRRLFRLVAGPLGALIAMVWAVPMAQRMGFGADLRQVSMVAPLTLFVTGLVWPPAVVFLAFGVPAGLLGGQLAGTNDWILGFGPGFFVGGALGVVMHRLVGAVLSAVAGAWLTVLGVLAVLNPFLSAPDWLANRPVAVLSVAGCLAIAGAVFQIFVRPSEEQAATNKIERTMAKKKAKEQKALEERWAKYHDRKQ